MDASLALALIVGAVALVCHGIGFRRGLRVGDARAVRRVGRLHR